MEILQSRLVERLARRDREVGAEEGLGLELDGATEIFAKRADAGERSNAEDDGQ